MPRNSNNDMSIDSISSKSKKRGRDESSDISSQRDSRTPRASSSYQAIANLMARTNQSVNPNTTHDASAPRQTRSGKLLGVNPAGEKRRRFDLESIYSVPDEKLATKYPYTNNFNAYFSFDDANLEIRRMQPVSVINNRMPRSGEHRTTFKSDTGTGSASEHIHEAVLNPVKQNLHQSLLEIEEDEIDSSDKLQIDNSQTANSIVDIIKQYVFRPDEAHQIGHAVGHAQGGPETDRDPDNLAVINKWANGEMTHFDQRYPANFINLNFHRVPKGNSISAQTNHVLVHKDDYRQDDSYDDVRPVFFRAIRPDRLPISRSEWKALQEEAAKNLEPAELDIRHKINQAYPNVFKTVKQIHQMSVEEGYRYSHEINSLYEKYKAELLSNAASMDVDDSVSSPRLTR